VPDITMPRLSDSMEEGTIIRWLKTDGALVRRGEEIVEIETDKATMAYEAEAGGVLEIIAGQGETLAVGTAMARLHGSVADREGARVVAAGVGGAIAVGVGVGGEIAEPPERVSASAGPVRAADRRANGPAASPVARRLATKLGVDLSLVPGSGPKGRIAKADVASYARTIQASLPVVIDTDDEPERLSRVQATVARRMTESKATVPDFSITMDITVDHLVRLRQDLAAATTRLNSSPAPTYNDFVVKACALSLREHPYLNGSYRDDQFESHGRVNVGIAVATGNSLLVPVIADADRLSLGAIAAERRRLTEVVRTGSATPPDLSSGTFTVSNLGMFGVDSFTAIINPPQAAILAVGAVAEAAIASHGELYAGWKMNLTLSCDHRIVMGAAAAEFLKGVRELLEEPLALML
jgi:pyruvate dehydrogenase E2 component (dihydrolipoamide acetyltransferase)